MKKIKVSEATPDQLNWLVAQIERDDTYKPRDYSGDWSFGGPIIEREEISIGFERYSIPKGRKWDASRTHGKGMRLEYGPTPLIAAMRCYVASKLGEEVEVPKELL